MNKKIIVVFISLLVITTILPEFVTANEPSEWWSMFRNNPNHSAFSPSLLPTANLNWSSQVFSNTYSSPAIVDGFVYIGSTVDSCPPLPRLSCIDLEDGEIEWDFNLGIDSLVKTSPAVVNDLVYIATGDTVFAISTNGIHEQWSRQLDSAVATSATVLGNYVYIASLRSLYCLETQTGHINWRYDTADHPEFNGDFGSAGDLCPAVTIFRRI